MTHSSLRILIIEIERKIHSDFTFQVMTVKFSKHKTFPEMPIYISRKFSLLNIENYLPRNFVTIGTSNTTIHKLKKRTKTDPN